MTTQHRLTRREWLLVAVLVTLALVPAVAGSLRLGELASGAPETPDNARFVQSPFPVVVHIVGALLYALVGIGQFLPTVRHRNLAWHRFAGRYLLVPAGLAVAGSGLWMATFYDLPPIDGLGLQISRYIVGVAMISCLALGIAAVLRRDISAHRAWMIRAYALALGAGTQVLTSIPPFLIFGAPDEFWRLVQMDAGWLINIVVAELVIARARRAVVRPPAPVPA